MICWLTINRICNLRCKWCYAVADDFKNSATMTLETIERIQGAISAKNISRFIILGGEPTLHPHLSAIIQRLKPNKVVLVTNAVKMADKTYLRLLKKNGLDVVTISLKGATEEQYQENTGVACLGAVEMTIANLNELGIPYSISVTFSDSIMKILPGIVELMKRNNAETMSMNYCRPVVLGNGVTVEGIPHPGEMAIKTVESYDLIRESGVKCVYNFMLPLCLLPFEFIFELVERKLLTTICQLQQGNGLIFMPDGSLIPCNHLFDYVLGKAGEDFNTPVEFERFRKREEIQEFYRKTKNLPDGRCQACSLKTRCGGGCFIQYLHYKPADIIRQPFERSMA